MRGNKKRLLGLLVAFTLVFSSAVSGMTCFAVAGEQDMQEKGLRSRPAYVEGELLIKFQDGTGLRGMSAFASDNGLRQKEAFEALDMGLFTVKSGRGIERALKGLSESDEIEYIQPNYLYYPAEVTPEDQFFSEMWGLNNNLKTEIDIDAPEAWDITEGESDIVVAVIDEGVDFSHPELKDRRWINSAEAAGITGVDDDGNGYVDDINGYDFYENNGSVFDGYDDHGTHVAGTIAAEANTAGVIGVAPKVKIMSLKFLGPDGGTTADAIKAIRYAASKGVKLSNNSWGGSQSSEDTALQQAIEASGMLFVAAAGNSGIDIDATAVSPASFDSENMLTVAAVNRNGYLADFSNHGEIAVDIAAPGVDILSTLQPIKEGTAAVKVSGTHKAFVATFGLEDLGSATKAADILEKAMTGISTGSKVMLVDDDGYNTGYYDYNSVYSSALTASGYTVAQAVYSSPTLAAMEKNDVVLWFTGKPNGLDMYDFKALTDTDQTNICSFLDKGKTFILFGQDALSNLESSALLEDYFDIEVAYSNYGRNEAIAGVAGSDFDGVAYALEGQARFTDHIKPISGGNAQSAILYKGDPATAYAKYNGTSMAAPHVTGIAALLLSKNPNLTTAELKAAILENGVVLDKLAANSTATGMMANAFNALKAVAPGKPALTASKSGNDVTLTWTGRESGDFKQYTVQRNIGNAGYNDISTTTDKSYVDSGIDLAKNYQYRIKAEDDYGNASFSNVVYGNRISTGGGTGGGGGGGGGAATVVDPAVDLKIEAALNNVTSKENVEVNTVRILNKESVEMKPSTLSALVKSGRPLVVKGQYSDIEIPASALLTEEVKKYMNDSNAKLTLSIKEIKGDASREPAADTMNGLFKVGERIFEFTAQLTTGSGKTDISSFAKELRISIRLTAQEIAANSENKLGVYYYNEEQKAWEYMGGLYDPQTGTMIFNTGHFSTFALMRTESTYTDIRQHWAKAEIELLAARHIIEPDKIGSFGPDVDITRGEIVKMLVNILRYDPNNNIDLITPANPSFKDVSPADPYYSYIETAIKHGITNGKGDGTFGSGDTVTREQLTAMIIRAMGMSAESDISALPFKDKDKIPAWAEKSIVAAYERGLVAGIEADMFGVGRTATRAQAAVILKRVIEKTGMIQQTVSFTGKLTVSEVEGRHFELVTEDDGTYVLIYEQGSRYLDKILNGSIGKQLEVTGYVQGGYSIYMRGKVLKVISVIVK